MPIGCGPSREEKSAARREKKTVIHRRCAGAVDGRSRASRRLALLPRLAPPDWDWAVFRARKRADGILDRKSHGPHTAAPSDAKVKLSFDATHGPYFWPPDQRAKKECSQGRAVLGLLLSRWMCIRLASPPLGPSDAQLQRTMPPQSQSQCCNAASGVPCGRECAKSRPFG